MWRLTVLVDIKACVGDGEADGVFGASIMTATAAKAFI